jgi:tetratricopeptide (TPR) repeat protein
MIRIRCPNPKCRKPLGVKDELAGRKVACPACKHRLVIPVPKAAPANLEEFATQALSDEPKPATKPVAPPQTVDFNCPYCDEALHLQAEFAGTQHPCPECRRIIKVPELKVEKPKDWRELTKKGAAAYLKSNGDDLEGVQGDVRTKVSTTALMEAGAVDKAPAPPPSLAARARRIAWGVGSLTLALLVAWGIYQARSGAVSKRILANTLAEIKKPDSKIPPLARAELLRGIGAVELKQGRRKEALEAYLQARALADAEAKTDPIGHDLFLLSLALDQVNLSGSDDDVLHHRRYDWEKVLLELKDTVEKIRSADAQGWTARLLGTRLAAAGKPEMGVQLARGSRDPAKDPKVKMLQVALILATNDADNIKFAHELLPPPSASRPLDFLTRAAYAEGFARQGKLDDALKLVKERGGPFDRLEAALAVIWALGDDPKGIAPFVEEAVKAAGELKQSVPTWHALQLLRVSAFAPIDEKVLANLVDSLPARLRERGQLEALRAAWRRTQQPAEATPIRAFRDDASLWAQGCFHLVRHNAALGQKPLTPAAGDEDILKAIIPLAHLLGEADRK